MNKLFVVLVGLSLMLVPQVVKAEDMPAPAAPVMEEAASAVDTMTTEGMGAMDDASAMAADVVDSHMGNKICPVSGEKIGEMGEGTEVEYNGKKIKLCCADCIEAFNKDPEGYVKMLEEKMAAETAGTVETATETAPAAEEGAAK